MKRRPLAAVSFRALQLCGFTSDFPSACLFPGIPTKVCFLAVASLLY
jgi:hypothetical protein